MQNTVLLLLIGAIFVFALFSGRSNIAVGKAIQELVFGVIVFAITWLILSGPRPRTNQQGRFILSVVAGAMGAGIAGRYRW